MVARAATGTVRTVSFSLETTAMPSNGAGAESSMTTGWPGRYVARSGISPMSPPARPTP